MSLDNSGAAGCRYYEHLEGQRCRIKNYCKREGCKDYESSEGVMTHKPSEDELIAFWEGK